MTTRIGLREMVKKGAIWGLTAQLAVGSVSPAGAQRRRGEPEANPQFQQSLQQPSEGGGPMDPEAPAPSASSLGPPMAEDPGSRGIQGVQIGTSQRRAAPVASVAPLDSRVTVRVKGAPLATFLDTISAQAKVNFIITEGLESKRVTAFLQNVTVREALQVLLEIKGLTYQQIGRSNTYVVTPRSRSVENLITRIYTLAYVPLISIGSAASEQAALNPLGSGGGAAAISNATQMEFRGGAAGSTQGGGGFNSDVAIIGVLRSVLSKSGKVSLEPRTNALVVTDIPEVFPQVEQIIAELDKKAPQIMIEAQIVEIDSNRTKDIGLEWGGSRGELASFTAGARDTSFPMQLPQNLSRVRFFDPIPGPGNVISSLGSVQTQAAEPGTTNDLKFGSFIKTSILDLTSLSITLRALVSRAEARFLGKPKILTLNNKAAIIQIAADTAVSVQQQTTGSSGGPTTVGNTVERVQTGLKLIVTPQVNKDGYITMLVQPSFTDVQESSISTAKGRIFDSVSRGASTLVRVKNGQTLVMGGLLQSTETKVVRKVPFFGYIPLIGWLFTSVTNSRKNADLVIFITPTVVSD